MTLTKDEEQLLLSLKRGDLKLELDDVVIVTPGGAAHPISLPVVLEVREGKPFITVRVPASKSVSPEIRDVLDIKCWRKKVYHVSDFYKAKAVSSDGLDIEIHGLMPHSHSQTQNWDKSFESFTLSFSEIHILPSGIANLSPSEYKELLQVLSPSSENRSPEQELRSCLCILPNVNLTLANRSGTTSITIPSWIDHSSTSPHYFEGKLLGGEYCIAQREGDVWVAFRTTIPSGATAPVAINSIMDGMLNALGFMQSFHPWPCYRREEHDNKVLVNWFRPPQQCSRKMFFPFSKSWVYEMGENNTNTLFELAAAYFATKREHAESFSHVLWLCREACHKGIATPVKLLTLCSALEGLLFRTSPIPKDGLKTKEQWRAAFEKLGFAWDNGFSTVYEAWDKNRHALAHGFGRSASGSVKACDSIFAASIITGAIYALMARHFGYKGKILFSELTNEVLYL